jgi:hypothetical protein
MAEQPLVFWGGEDIITESVSVNVDEVGVCEVVQTMLCKDESAVRKALDVKPEDMPVPLFYPYVKATSADRIEAGMWKVTRTFSAVISEDSDALFKVYSCETIANHEPIQTHPDFLLFAGIPTAPKNGAVYDLQSGDFMRFAPYLPDGTKNRKAGITDYKVPIISFSEVRIVFEDELASYVRGSGFVDDSPPDHPLRPRFKKRNWLLVQCDPEWVTEQTYRLTRKWACSGPRGWDRTIYPAITMPK